MIGPEPGPAQRSEAVLFDIDGTLMIPGSWRDDPSGLGQFYPGVEPLLHAFYTEHCRPRRGYRLGIVTGSDLLRIRLLCDRLGAGVFDDGLWFGEMGLVAYIDGRKILTAEPAAGRRLAALRKALAERFVVYEPHEQMVSVLPTATEPLEGLEARFFTAYPAYRGLVEVSTSTEAMDITPRGMDKRSAVKYLRSRGYARVHYLGDSSGDLPALHTILDRGLGIAAVVGQAAPGVTDLARAQGVTVLEERETAAVQRFLELVLDSAA